MSELIEKQLLGTFIIEPSLICRDLDDIFSSREARVIYTSILNVLDDGGHVDAVKVADGLSLLDPNISFPVTKVAELLDYVGHSSKKYLSADVRWAIRKLRERKARRELARAAGDKTVEFEELRDSINAIPVNDEIPHGSTTGDGLVALLSDLQIPEEQRMFSGFETFDRASRGWRRGDLVAFMGRPTVGKTWWMLNVASYLAGRKYRISFFSLEGPVASTMERVAQIHYNLTSWDMTPSFILNTAMRDPGFTARYEKVTWHNRIYSVREMGEIIDSETPDVVFIDFLGLIRSDIEGSPYERMSRILVDLKALAIEKNILVIFAVQISRLGEDGTVPVRLNHARDSGQIEELSDFIFGAWRPEIHSEDSEKRHTLSVEYLKVKRGESVFKKMRLYPTGRIEETKSE